MARLVHHGIHFSIRLCLCLELGTSGEYKTHGAHISRLTHQSAALSNLLTSGPVEIKNSNHDAIKVNKMSMQGWVYPFEIQPLETRPAGGAVASLMNLLFSFVIGQTYLSMLCTMKVRTHATPAIKPPSLQDAFVLTGAGVVPKRPT